MSHFSRAQPDAVWVRGYVTLGVDMRAIDRNTYAAINGDEGGTWSPSSQIVIAGEGAIAAGPWTMSGASVKVTTSADAPITFDNGAATDYFGLSGAHSGVAPEVHVDLFEQAGLGGALKLLKGERFHFLIPVYSGAAKIDYAVVAFKVGEAHANVPASLPRIRVIAVATDGTITPLRARDATTDADGFQHVGTPASGAAWYNGGAAKAATYTCNVVLPVDSGTHLYFVEIVEESGTNAWVTTGNIYLSCRTVYSSVALFDGRN